MPSTHCGHSGDRGRFGCCSMTITTARRSMPGSRRTPATSGTFGDEAEESLDRAARYVLAQGPCRGDGACHRIAAASDPDGRRARSGGSPCATCPRASRRPRCCAAGSPSGWASARTAGCWSTTRASPSRSRRFRCGCGSPSRCGSRWKGNAHFCRGLLATRYADDEAGGAVPVITNIRTDLDNGDVRGRAILVP